MDYRKMQDGDLNQNEIEPTLDKARGYNLAPITVHKESPSNEKFRVGTLQYTRIGLITVFIWLLWGDFCFSLMQVVTPSILPLKMEGLKAPNWLIGLVLTTIPSMMNLLVNPTISFRSDRFRSRWGRRIPFLFWATPFVAVSLIAMGYSDEIGRFLHASVVSNYFQISPTITMLATVAILMASFQFFDMFIGSIYYYLFNDVVPSVYLARCMSLFRVVGVGAGALYNFLLLPYAKTHMKEIFVGAAVLYFIGFMLMCWKVKEGQYPPPPDNIGHKKGIWAAAKTYFLECYTHRFYWNFFLMNTFLALIGCMSPFNLLYSMSLGLTLKQLGLIGGLAGILSTILLYPAGMLADKFHPIRIMFLGVGGLTIASLVGFIYLFYDFTPSIVFIITCATSFVVLPFSTLYAAANLPMYMRILPKDRYGQFGSADAIIRSIAMICGGMAAGFLMDTMKTIYGGNEYYYRFIPCWTVACLIAALFFMSRVYRGIKEHGGLENYVPPSTEVGGQ